MVELTVTQKLNGTLAGYIARELDKKDGKKDGYIDKTVWNAFVGKIKLGKEIKNKISTEAAMNSIATYARRTAKSTDKTETQIAKQWKAEFLENLNVQIQDDEETTSIKQKPVEIPDELTKVQSLASDVIKQQDFSMLTPPKYNENDGDINTIRELLGLENSEAQKQTTAKTPAKKNTTKTKKPAKEQVKLADGSVVPKKWETTYKEMLKYVQDNEYTEDAVFSVKDGSLIVKYGDDVIVDTEQDAKDNIQSMDILQDLFPPKQKSDKNQQPEKERVKLADGSVVPEKWETTYNEMLKYVQDNGYTEDAVFSVKDGSIIVKYNNDVIVDTEQDAKDNIQSMDILKDLFPPKQKSVENQQTEKEQVKLADESVVPEKWETTYKEMLKYVQDNGYTEDAVFSVKDGSLIVKYGDDVIVDTEQDAKDNIQSMDILQDLFPPKQKSDKNQQPEKEQVTLADGSVVPEEYKAAYNEMLKYVQENEYADKVEFKVENGSLIVYINENPVIDTQSDLGDNKDPITKQLEFWLQNYDQEPSNIGDGGFTIRQSLPDGTVLSPKMSRTYQTLRTILQHNGFYEYCNFKMQGNSLVVSAMLNGEIILKTKEADEDAIRKLQTYIDSKK